MKHPEKSIEFDKTLLKEELMRESKSTNLYDDAANCIVNIVVDNVAKWMESRSIVTESDYQQIVSTELAKTSPDLAYIYLNRDKII